MWRGAPTQTPPNRRGLGEPPRAQRGRWGHSSWGHRTSVALTAFCPQPPLPGRRSHVPLCTRPPRPRRPAHRPTRGQGGRLSGWHLQRADDTGGCPSRSSAGAAQGGRCSRSPTAARPGGGSQAGPCRGAHGLGRSAPGTTRCPPGLPALWPRRLPGRAPADPAASEGTMRACEGRPPWTAKGQGSPLLLTHLLGSRAPPEAGLPPPNAQRSPEGSLPSARSQTPPAPRGKLCTV